MQLPNRHFCSFFVASILCASGHVAHAADFPITAFDVLQGEVVEAVLQDSTGYIWLASGRGLWRGHTRGFAPVMLSGKQWAQDSDCLMEDDHSRLWVGTLSGLQAIDVKTLTPLTVPEELSQARVLSMFRGRGGRMWLGTTQGLYELLADHNAARVRRVAGSESEVVLDIAETDSGLWLSVIGGLLQFDEEGVHRRFEELIGDGRATLLGDGNTLWVGLRYKNGLYRIHGDGHITRVTAEDGLRNDEINGICRSSDDVMWVATEDGVYFSRGQQFAEIGRTTGLHNSDVHDLIEDREGQMWFASFGSGVYLLRSPDIRIYGKDHGLAHPMVLALARSPNGALLTGTVAGPNRIVGSDVEPIFPGGLVRRIHVDRAGQAWFGGRGHVWREGDANRGHLDAGFYSFGEDDQGLLVGIFNGLIRYDGRDRSAVPLPVKDEFLYSITTAPDGHIVLGTAHGILAQNADGWSTHLPEQIVQDILYDEDTPWIASAEGVLRLDSEFAVLETHSIGRIFELAIDEQGVLWAAGDMGLFRAARGGFERFTRADGLPSSITRSIQPDGPHTLWVGTTYGLARIDTRYLEPCRAPPLITLSVVHQPQGRVADGIQVPVDDQGLIVEVDCVGSRSAEGVTYQHRLDRRDKEWSEPSETPYIRVSGLAPGDYTLAVRAANIHGMTSATDTTITFEIVASSWWPMASLIGGLMAAGAVVVIVARVQSGRLRANVATVREEYRVLNLELQHTRKLSLVGQLAAGVAHELNNLLTALIGHCESLSDRVKTDRIGQDSIAGIQTVVEQAGAITRPLGALSKKTDDRPSGPQNLASLFESGVALVRPALPAHTHVVVSNIAASDLAIAMDPAQFHQVLVNLIFNARDAMDQGGTITLGVEHHRRRREGWPVAATGPFGYAIIDVTDQGGGIADHVRENLFQPFVTTKGEGIGLGLAVVRDLVTAAGGAVTTRAVERGSCFSVALPCCQPGESPTIAAKPQGHEGRGRFVLLAEDHPQVRHIVIRVLTGLSYDVKCAGDGRTLLDLFETYGPQADLVILDVDLPVVDGVACLREIRNTRRDLPVLIITGYPQIASDVLEDPNTRLLPKPFKMAALAEVVKQMIGSESDMLPR